MVIVCFPYEFTLLSNLSPVSTSAKLFVSPTNLHCSQTTFLPRFISAWFVSPTNLHCSQTVHPLFYLFYPFVSPTNLHCSQTDTETSKKYKSLFPLRIYTALKLCTTPTPEVHGLFPLRIYTALKL